jgi:hypothetical protein
MVKVFSNGPMGEFILVTILRTKNMVLVLSSGPMVRFMKDTGNKGSRMGRVKSEDLMELKDREFGKMVIELGDGINFCNF